MHDSEEHDRATCGGEEQPILLKVTEMERTGILGLGIPTNGLSILGSKVSFPTGISSKLVYSSLGLPIHNQQAIKTSAHKTMDPRLYKAAMEGKVVELEQLIHGLDIHHQLTQYNSTVLHVAAQFGKLTCVEKILVLKGSPSLLARKNIKGDTALHVAARQGHNEIVRELVSFAKQVGSEAALLREPNEDEDRALHLAVKNGDLEMVELLTKADPQFPYPPNKAQKTPLYLASERGYDDVVSKITSPTYSVADGGRNALHAAVVSKCTVQTIENLLDQQPDLIKEVDEYGWTPLHWAVRINNVEKVSKLLEKDQSSSVAYTPANDDDEKIALHIAAAHGHVDVMEELLFQCPDSWEIVDGEGQNILHIAVEAEQSVVIDAAKKYPWFNHLINQKDNVGNTPLDLASGRHLLYQNLIRGYDMNLTLDPVIWDQISREKHYIPRRKQELKEKRNRDIEYFAQLEKKLNKQMVETHEQLSRTSESHLLVATLIATIAFMLGFTAPAIDRSSNDKSGEPVLLLKEEAFKAFLISNSIAAICSITTVLLYITVSSYSADLYKPWYIDFFYKVVYYVIRVSVAAILFAFIAGTYAVLTHPRGLVYGICVLGFLPFILYLKVGQFCSNLFERVYKSFYNILY